MNPHHLCGGQLLQAGLAVFQHRSADPQQLRGRACVLISHTRSARGKMGAALCCPRVVLLTAAAAAASAAGAAIDRQPHDALAGFSVDPVAGIGAPPVVSEGGNTIKKDKRNQEHAQTQSNSA